MNLLSSFRKKPSRLSRDTDIFGVSGEHRAAQALIIESNPARFVSAFAPFVPIVSSRFDAASRKGSLSADVLVRGQCSRRTVDRTDVCCCFYHKISHSSFPRATARDYAIVHNACTRSSEWLLWLVEGSMRWPLLLLAVLLRPPLPLGRDAAWRGMARRRPL